MLKKKRKKKKLIMRKLSDKSKLWAILQNTWPGFWKNVVIKDTKGKTLCQLKDTKKIWQQNAMSFLTGILEKIKTPVMDIIGITGKM